MRGLLLKIRHAAVFADIDAVFAVIDNLFVGLIH